EGHDLFVLRGFPFADIRPKIIIAEFDNKKTETIGYTHRDIGDLLYSLNYRVYLSEWFPIEKYGSLHKFRRLSLYPTPLLDSIAWGNFIAIDKNDSGNFDKYLSLHPVRKYIS
ncbi:MAG: hypothetical protein WBW71_04790, partial [Bacteroidota bacterium]